MDMSRELWPHNRALQIDTLDGREIIGRADLFVYVIIQHHYIKQNEGLIWSLHKRSVLELLRYIKYDISIPSGYISKQHDSKPYT